MLHNDAFMLNAQKKPSYVDLFNAKDYSKQLVVGQKVPAEFWTQKHLFLINGDTLTKDLSAYKGKILVLNFWATWCSGCLDYKKQIDSIVHQRNGELNVLMVNPQITRDCYSSILKFLPLQKTVDLSVFTTIIHDQYLESKFPHYVFPYFAWINKRGIFQIGTFRNLLDERYQAPFIALR